MKSEEKQKGEIAKKLEMMTSLQIAEITGKPHNDVLKAIRNNGVCMGKSY